MSQTGVKTDEELVQQIAEAGPGAAEEYFQELYDRYAGLLLGFCGSHVGRDKADDVSQVVWQRVWTALLEGRYDGTNFRALLLRIAKNLIVDGWRRKKLEPEQKEQLDRFEDNAGQSPAARLLHEERMDRLRSCLERLRAAHHSRATVAEMKMAVASVSEICEQLGVDRNRVDKLWFEARKALQACVSRGET
jgi:RNA polymerase sigma factor (sigma-70 family)